MSKNYFIYILILIKIIKDEELHNKNDAMSGNFIFDSSIIKR